VLYLINNILYLLGLQLTTPSLLHVAMLAKLTLTGVLHHFVVRRQKNLYAWISVACICSSLLLFNAPVEVFQRTAGTRSAEAGVPNMPDFGLSYLIWPLTGLVIAEVSAFASIVTEMAMKQDISFMVAQVWLYLYDTVFAASILLFWNGRVTQLTPSTRVQSPSMAWVVDVHAAVINATAVTGLVMANILRRADNLIKLVETSSAVVTSIIAQVVLFPRPRLRTIHAHSTLVVGIIEWLHEITITTSRCRPMPGIVSATLPRSTTSCRRSQNMMRADSMLTVRLECPLCHFPITQIMSGVMVIRGGSLDEPGRSINVDT